jgi:hypothetical protein
MKGVEASFENGKQWIRFRFEDREETYRFRDVCGLDKIKNAAIAKIDKKELARAVKKEIDKQVEVLSKQCKTKEAEAAKSKENIKRVENAIRLNMIAKKAKEVAKSYYSYF